MRRIYAELGRKPPSEHGKYEPSLKSVFEMPSCQSIFYGAKGSSPYIGTKSCHASGTISLRQWFIFAAAVYVFLAFATKASGLFRAYRNTATKTRFPAQLHFRKSTIACSWWIQGGHRRGPICAFVEKAQSAEMPRLKTRLMKEPRFGAIWAHLFADYANPGQLRQSRSIARHRRYQPPPTPTLRRICVISARYAYFAPMSKSLFQLRLKVFYSHLRSRIISIHNQYNKAKPATAAPSNTPEPAFCIAALVEAVLGAAVVAAPP